MSSASTLLAAGFAVNLQIHGEALGYAANSIVQVAETGDVITNETADAALSEAATLTSITGIFDEDHMVGLDVITTTPAAIVKATDVTGVQKNALIVRTSTGVTYYVLRAEEPQPDGSQLLILSKDAH